MNTVKTIGTIGVMAIGFVSSTAALATHDGFCLHIYRIKGSGDWLTFDVTASHGTFVFDKPAGSDRAFVIMPDGCSERPNFVVGKTSFYV